MEASAERVIVRAATRGVPPSEGLRRDPSNLIQLILAKGCPAGPSVPSVLSPYPAKGTP